DRLILCITPKTSVKPIPSNAYVAPNSTPSATDCTASIRSRTSTSIAGTGQYGRKIDGKRLIEWTTADRRCGPPECVGPSGRWFVQDQPASTLGMDVEKRLDGFAIGRASDLAQEAVRFFQRR